MNKKAYLTYLYFGLALVVVLIGTLVFFSNPSSTITAAAVSSSYQCVSYSQAVELVDNYGCDITSGHLECDVDSAVEVSC